MKGARVDVTYTDGDAAANADSPSKALDAAGDSTDPPLAKAADDDDSDADDEEAADDDDLNDVSVMRLPVW